MDRDVQIVMQSDAGAAGTGCRRHCGSKHPGSPVHFPALEADGSACCLGTHCLGPGEMALTMAASAPDCFLAWETDVRTCCLDACCCGLGKIALRHPQLHPYPGNGRTVCCLNSRCHGWGEIVPDTAATTQALTVAAWAKSPWPWLRLSRCLSASRARKETGMGKIAWAVAASCL